MADRITVGQLDDKPLIQNAPNSQTVQKLQNSEPNLLPADPRPEVPRGDPDKEGTTHTKTEMQQIEIATPTARLLFQIEDHFPMDPWPDLLIVDEVKVSFVYKRPLSSGNVQSILIKDITDVSITGNPLWSALTITGGDYRGNPAVIDKAAVGKGPLMMKFLNKKEGAKARRLIFGLMIMHDRKVDTSKMPVAEVVKRAEEVGRARKDPEMNDDSVGGEGASE